MTLSTSAVAVCCDDSERSVRAQLLEQPRILDGNDGLPGEIGEQGSTCCR